MNYLELAQEVRQGVGMQGSGPSSIVGATPAEQDIIKSVRDAWVDIQNYRKNWMWMRTTQTFSLTLGDTTYSLLTIFGPGNRFKNWIKDTMYAQVSGQWKRIRFVEYDTFVDRYINSTKTGPPEAYTIVPWNNYLMFNTPDGEYDIRLDYYKSPQMLESASDEPEFPEYYHLLIKYLAIAKYSTIVIMPEIQSENFQNYAVMMGQLLRDQIMKKSVQMRGIA